MRPPASRRYGTPVMAKRMKLNKIKMLYRSFHVKHLEGRAHGMVDFL